MGWLSFCLKKKRKSTKEEPPPEQAFANNDRYKCQLCNHLAIDPITLACGHLFCCLCIAKWTGLLIGVHRKCPTCLKTITRRRIDPLINEEIEQMVDDFTPEERLKRREFINVHRMTLDSMRSKPTVDLLYQRQSDICFWGPSPGSLSSSSASSASSHDFVELRHSRRLQQLVFRDLPISEDERWLIGSLQIDLDDRAMRLFDDNRNLLVASLGDEYQEETDLLAMKSRSSSNKFDVVVTTACHVWLENRWYDDPDNSGCVLFRAVSYNQHVNRINFDKRRAFVTNLAGEMLSCVEGEAIDQEDLNCVFVGENSEGGTTED